MAAEPAVLAPVSDVDKRRIWNELIEQLSGLDIFADSKHFVDCPVRSSWPDVAKDWEALKLAGVTVTGVHAFLETHFGEPGRDLKPVLPLGWTEAAPSWTAHVPDPDLRSLSTGVYGLWKTLCRQVSPTVVAHPDRHTLLPLPHPFIIPGDRFRECYNWDSYWIIRGLIASELLPAAEQLLRNLLDLVDRWGFVPNGARTYYTNRSQPPLLSAMVLAVWSAGGSGDNQLLADALPRLIKQHGYWTSGNKAVALTGNRSHDAAQGPGGDSTSSDADAADVFVLSRYHAELYSPRPESYREDVHLAAKAGLSGTGAAQLFCDIASAAESGWDFSTRWFVGGDSLEYTRTTQIIPADLNAWLYRMERDIAAIAGHLGDEALRDQYAALAAQRLRAINALMWSEREGCWHDLQLRHPSSTSATFASTSHSVRAVATASPSNGSGGGGAQTMAVYGVEQRTGVYASNWVPLWCGCAEAGGAQAAAAVAGLRASGLIQEGGLLTSLYPSGQQWDAPNAWPPLVHMAIEGLSESGTAEGPAAAAALAERWVRANLVAWQATGHMHEKYGAYEPGSVGGGGEYAPQVGFGWSNGVLLDLMHCYCRGSA